MLLQRGDRGPEVRELQRRLGELDYHVGPADGIFGPMTEQAVRAFQDDRGLMVDGIAGPMTLGELGLADEEGDGPGETDQPDPGPVRHRCGELEADREVLARSIARAAERERERWHRNGTKRETDPKMSPVLRDYFATGIGRTVTDEEVQDEDWQRANPWSAAFISWVVCSAGGGDAFAYHAAHQHYIAAAKRNREAGDRDNPFWAYRVSERGLRVGDIVCAERRDSGASFENIDQRFRACHCDVVTMVTADQVIVVGGNVGDTVDTKTLQLDRRGRIDLSGRQSRFFAIVSVLGD